VKERLFITILITFTLLVGLNAYAEINLFTWYEKAFHSKMEEVETTIKNEENTIREEIDSIMNIALLETENSIHKLKPFILSGTATSIENHKSDYLSQLAETEKELNIQNFNEYEKEKSEEIRHKITEDMEYFINELLN